jgi:hypothetical protein
MSSMGASIGPTEPFAPCRLPAADEPTVSHEVRRLSRGQAAALVLSATLGLVVAGYGLAGSYVTVSDLAARRGLAGREPDIGVGVEQQFAQQCGHGRVGPDGRFAR